MSKYAPSIPPFHLLVSEPELKWCEAICEDARISRLPASTTIHRITYPPKLTRDEYKVELMTRTNMSEIRVDRALNLLYYSKRI